uniref:uncharacterized protein isoform X2 n=1 Tax=Myxine glutinosa TaxID=7769 RepID=UPI00358E7675
MQLCSAASKVIMDQLPICQDISHGNDEEICEDQRVCCVKVPSELAARSTVSRRKLVLHMDVNCTVLLSDSVMGMEQKALLNYYLSSVTWGHYVQGSWKCIGDTTSFSPPCPGARTFASVFGRSTTFTENEPGCTFRSIFNHSLSALRWQHTPNAYLSVSNTGSNGKYFHLLLPGFFQLLTQLHQCGRDFAVIFRSFGSDLCPTLAAVHQWALGHHPDFPHVPSIQVCLSPGKVSNSKYGVALEIESHSVSAKDGPRAAYNLLSNLTGVCGLQDSYTWWTRNGYSCHGGKPFWVDPQDPSVHHVFFDDNIRLEDEDSIVLPLVFNGPGPPRQVPTADLLGSCLIRTDLLAAIHNVNWFYERLCEAEIQYECYVHSLMHSST